MYIRYFWQAIHHTYGHIRCRCTVLANPTHDRIFDKVPLKTPYVHRIYMILANPNYDAIRAVLQHTLEHAEHISLPVPYKYCKLVLETVCEQTLCVWPLPCAL